MSDLEKEYLNVSDGVSRMCGNESLYRTLLGKFEPSVNISGYDMMVEEKNWEELGKIVHTAKGIAGNLSLTAFYEESVILMDQLRNGGVPQEADIKLFRQLYTETLDAVSAYLG